jgi:nicotinamide-nucleotide amidase
MTPRARSTRATSTEVPTLLGAHGGTLAVAESLTGGLLSSHFAQMHGASEWFRGGVVAYSRAVKEELLGIGCVPVVSESAARSMVTNVATLLDATVAVAVTGVGGPGAQDGVPAGTVWIAIRTPARLEASIHRFRGSPAEVCDRTCSVASELLADAIESDLGALSGRGR